jgi:hypothetical protein
VDDEVTDVYSVRSLDHQGARDLAAVHVGPVGAFEIDDNELAVLHHDPGMPFRDVPLGEHHVVALHTTDGDLVLVELKSTLLTAFFGDHYSEHGASTG